MKYRRRMNVVEAWQYTGEYAEMPQWLMDALDAQGEKILCQGDTFIISTLEGEMIAQQGDWIIRGIRGELYPCKPDIFEATYEESSNEVS